MQVPKYIQDKLIRVARVAAEHKKLDVEMREWFAKNNILNDGVLDQYIDTVDYGDGNILEFISFLESDDFNKGNDPNYT